MVFESLGVTKRQETIFRVLVDEPHLTKPALCNRLAVDEVGLDADLSRLQALGLLREDPVDQRLIVTDPEASVGLLVRDQQRQLDAMLAESVDLAHRVRRNRQANELSSIIEIVTGGEAITSRWEHAQKTARKCIRMTDRPPYYAGAKIEGMNIQLERMAEGFPFHTIYDARIFEHPEHIRRARLAIDSGEVARVLPEVPIKLVLVDDELAFLVLLSSEERREPTVIIVYESALLDSLTELFRLLWNRGVVMPSGLPSTQHPELSDSQRTLIALMASGLKDEAIAVEMGVGARTVRRKVQELYELLGVRTRFQAGVAANQRGWL